MSFVSLISLVAKQLQLDKRVFYTLLFRVSQLFVGGGTVLAITHWFEQVEQGYYYTFFSLVELQVLFEMGLSFVILQFVGHTFAVLSWTPERTIKGPAEAVDNFRLFLFKSARFYFFIALAVLVAVFPVGYLFFMKTQEYAHINWQLPWLLLCFFTAANLLTTPFLAAIQGSGHVVQFNQFKTIQNTLGAIGMWLGMYLGAQLYSIAIDLGIGFLIAVIWLAYTYRHLLTHALHGWKNRLSEQIIASLNWRSEVWPMQWRIAVTWISGYFLSQLYTPILFYYHGPIEAGKIGMSILLCNMLSVFALAFITAHNPEICQLIAKSRWQRLLQLFRRTTLQGVVLMLVAITCIVIAFYMPIFEFLTSRLVTLPQLLCLLLGTLFTFLIGAIAQLLRAFKHEPFMKVTVIGAVLNGSLSWYFGQYFSATGIVIVYLLLHMLFGLPTAIWLWYKHTKHIDWSKG